MKFPDKVYIIRHKQTQKHYTLPDLKRVWQKPGDAKNSWLNHWYVDNGEWKRRGRFDDQGEYEIVEIHTSNLPVYNQSVLLLKMCLGRCDKNLEGYIEDWLEEHGQS